jgi:hypothetical protein
VDGLISAHASRDEASRVVEAVAYCKTLENRMDFGIRRALNIKSPDTP